MEALAVVTSLLVASSLPAAWWPLLGEAVVAQGSVVIPYEAYLERGGVPVDEALGLRFELWDAATSGNLIWQETHASEMISGGHFHVALGSVTALTQAALRPASGAVYLQIVLLETPEVALTGRQLLGAVPYAWGGAPGEDFEISEAAIVRGRLSVTGDAELGGELRAGPTGDRLVLTAAGRVGVGTATPSATLHVAGDATLDGGLNPTYDSGWFAINSSCNTYNLSLGFSGLPRLISAYYKRSNGQVFPWGLNQYGDANQGNGVLLDLDEAGTLYVRLPCGNAGGSSPIHLGYYRSRDNSSNENLFSQTDLQFRVLAWR
jgi:hypothetical protein